MSQYGESFASIYLGAHIKRIRKAGNICEYCNNVHLLSNLKGSTLVWTYSFDDIGTYLISKNLPSNDIMSLYFIVERMWEDLSRVVCNNCLQTHKHSPFDEKGKKIVDKVIENMTTKLGAKTEYIDTYDPTLLHPIPREGTRKSIGYKDDVPFVGIDIWNAYEFSTLLKNGQPTSFMLRIGYDSDSKNIVESKSLKLYLNSFNNSYVENIEKVIISDLKRVVKPDFIKVLSITNVPLHTNEEINKNYFDLNILGEKETGFTYDYNPLLLKVIPAASTDEINLFCNSLKSNCRHSGLPDWGTAYISYIPRDKQLDPTSLLNYLISYRNHKEFHEECCERIMYDLINILKPTYLKVTLQYTRRGGIDINPIRIYSSKEYHFMFLEELYRHKKEVRQ